MNYLQRILINEKSHLEFPVRGLQVRRSSFRVCHLEFSKWTLTSKVNEPPYYEPLQQRQKEDSKIYDFSSQRTQQTKKMMEKTKSEKFPIISKFGIPIREMRKNN